MPSRSDIPNSNLRIVINLHFPKRDNWAVTYGAAFSYANLSDNWCSAYTFIWRSIPSSNHVFIHSANIRSTHNVPGISEMCCWCSDLTLIKHFPIEIWPLRWSLLDSGKQRALPRSRDSELPCSLESLVFRVWCLGQAKAGSVNWAGTLSLDQDCVFPKPHFSPSGGSPNHYCFPTLWVDQMPQAPDLPPMGSAQSVIARPWFWEGSLENA